jgi:hypothetical protein
MLRKNIINIKINDLSNNYLIFMCVGKNKWDTQDSLTLKYVVVYYPIVPA